MASTPAPVSVRTALSNDTYRRAVVTACAVFCLAAVLVGLVLARTAESVEVGGFLRADATLLAPGRPAFKLGWVIYLLTAAYTIWQWLPSARTSQRARATGYFAAGAFLLNGLWIFVAESSALWGSVVVILALWATLLVLLVRVSRVQADSPLERQVTQLPFAPYLGWVSVVCAQNVAAALAGSKVRPPFVSAETWAVIGLLIVLAVGLALVRYLPGRVFIGLAMAWGLVWIAYARVLHSPRSIAVAAASLVAALLLVFAGITVLLWQRSRAND